MGLIKKIAYRIRQFLVAPLEQTLRAYQFNQDQRISILIKAQEDAQKELEIIKKMLVNQVSSSKGGKDCPVCNSISVPYLEKRGYGYFKCTECGFLFIPDGQKFFGADFYRSDEYYKDSSSWPKDQRLNHFKLMLSQFTHPRSADRILDYGCGEKDLEEKSSLGPIDFFDPYQASKKVFKTISELPIEKYKKIVVSEVIEHLENPNGLISDLDRLSAEDVEVILSTWTTDAKQFSDDYINLSSGHIGIHSKKSLEIAFSKQGFNIYPTGYENFFRVTRKNLR